MQRVCAACATACHTVCSCCMFMLHVHAACPCFSYPCCVPMQHVCAACPCFISMLHAHATCLCCMFMLYIHAARSCNMSVLHVHAACPCCMSMLYVHAAYQRLHAAFPCFMCDFRQKCSTDQSKTKLAAISQIKTSFDAIIKIFRHERIKLAVISFPLCSMTREE
jgi:hypothetical protein